MNPRTDSKPARHTAKRHTHTPRPKVHARIHITTHKAHNAHITIDIMQPLTLAHCKLGFQTHNGHVEIPTILNLEHIKNKDLAHNIEHRLSTICEQHGKQGIMHVIKKPLDEREILMSMSYPGNRKKENREIETCFLISKEQWLIELKRPLDDNWNLNE